MEKIYLKELFVFVFLNLCCFTFLNAQINNSVDCENYASDRFEVLLYSDSKEETPNFNLTNLHSKVETLFKEFNISICTQLYPFAKTKLLREVYQIGCESCDIDSLISIINSDVSYVKHIKFTKKYCLDKIELYDPVDGMWQNNRDWLWHLTMIDADKAWDLTRGSPNVKVALIDTDFDISHPDLKDKINPKYDPKTKRNYACTPSPTHGTCVASFIAAETTEIGNIPKGSLAAVGFNSTIVAYDSNGSHQDGSGNFSTYIQKAFHASDTMSAQVLTSCAGFNSGPPNPDGIDKSIVKHILDNGTSIIAPAGNGPTGSHNYKNPDMAFFPLNARYDDRVITVSSIGSDKKHFFMSNGVDKTHSHYKDVDFCAPGYGVMGAVSTNCGENTWPYFGNGIGTSFAAPIVAGVAALMYDINPCMSPSLCKDILKNTTTPIADAADYHGLVGTGIVNAYNAVKAAQTAYSESLDLYIKDRLEDFGESGGYDWQASRDQSPDIWVRNQQDGFTNKEHQNPKLTGGNYVYVKVRNKSCEDALGSEKISLYWSKAASWSSWPNNWDGSDPNIGGIIGSVNINKLEAGKDSIFEFLWTDIDTTNLNDWAICLLARIENSSLDPITIYPGRLDNDIYFNNNIANRNVVVVDYNQTPAIDGLSKFMFIGNAHENEDKLLDIEFISPKNIFGEVLLDNTEVDISFDDVGWKLLHNVLKSNANIRIVGVNTIRILKDTVRLENIVFPKGLRTPIKVSFRSLVDHININRAELSFSVNQFLPKYNSLCGGVHYIVRKPIEKRSFKANAGDDVEVLQNEEITLVASDILEPAIYNWYDSNEELLGSGKEMTFVPIRSDVYKLEVVADSDGYKDYDDVFIKVKENYIVSISPNPTNDQTMLVYKIKEGEENFKLRLTNALGANVLTINLSSDRQSVIINTSDLIPGSYNLILDKDGLSIDSKILIKQ